jgi:hypothetical protein
MAEQGSLAERVGHYLVSVPERVVRSASGLAGGLLRELGDVALPPGLRRTKLYQNMVESTLRFLIEQVGQVEGAYPEQGRLADNFAMRRAAGNGIELAGIVAFRASPVWVMAALADVSGAGRHLVREIAESLKEEGLLEKDASFTTVDQLLDGLERSSGRIADTINTPPLDVAGLRADWQAIRADLASVPLPSPQVLDRLWRDIKAEAAAQNRSVFQLSSLMALSAARAAPERIAWFGRSSVLAARRTWQFLGEPLLEHYRATIDTIRVTGFLNYWAQEYRPYLRAAAMQFSPGRRTLTERFLRPEPPRTIAEDRKEEVADAEPS